VWLGLPAGVSEGRIGSEDCTRSRLLKLAAGPVAGPLAPSFAILRGGCSPLNGRMLRVVRAAGVAYLNAFLASEVARKLVAAGRVVGTQPVDELEARDLWPDVEALEAADTVARPIEW